MDEGEDWVIEIKDSQTPVIASNLLIHFVSFSRSGLRRLGHVTSVGSGSSLPPISNDNCLISRFPFECCAAYFRSSAAVTAQSMTCNQEIDLQKASS